ncbi:type I-E CRISPR-associated protein Cas6/Cse3/CasE [Gordonia sihwensis]|uniref:type I-E CRISPR-associated protein Cas6/Cse3/CasE n=1 Tax=Gordonia sihwensis TaxID=173559 RepID=UPI0005F03708|nr:type I-E CRISPR-associated protein Cas6/Cse3/CasE [Gordonia sihwensis]KJR10507.1 hypothetical protein UG54_00480 [Gordonia sihwensis]
MTPTLYRSALHLDHRHPAVAGALVDVHWLHRHIMSGWAHYTETHDFFTGTTTGHPNHRESLGILFAVSRPRPDGGIVILTQAHQPPDWNRAADTARGTAAMMASRNPHRKRCADTTKYVWTDALLDTPVDTIRTIEDAGTRIVFELRGAPSKKSGGTRQRLDDHHADNWAIRKLQDAGLTLTNSTDQPLTGALPVRLRSATKTERTRTQQKHGGSFQLDTLRWQGSATITDHAAYTEAITNGIGPGKAYGCGFLLTRATPHQP